MTTVMLALLLATQIQSADDVSAPMAAASYARLRDQLRDAETLMREAETRMCGINAFFNVAKNARMPSFVLDSVQREQQIARHEITDRRFTVEIIKRKLLEEIRCRDHGSGSLIGYLCPHCGKVHASSR
jgi:hypothetical protein